jgi:DNA-binding transcriptional ArsR family regulator
VNKPKIAEGMGFINYAWPDLKLRVLAERYDNNGYAELSFYLKNGSAEQLLHTTRVNLLATPTMNSLAKRLNEGASAIPWTEVLTYVTGKTIQIARRGEPVKEIWASEEDTLNAIYLLEPLLYLNHPTVIFGDYGSLKSLFALAIGYIVQLPYSDNNLGLITPKESTICLYLDYEDDPLNFRKRWSAIEKGFGIEAAMPILYRRMTTPLADSVESLQSTIVDKDIKLLIIDSLGPAARGNLNDPEPAIKYHEGLRKLGITSLTIAHNAKDPITRNRTIFGSVFFTNLARSVWECKAEQEIGEDEAIISVKNTKANLSKKHLPLGYRFTFTDKSIAIAKIDLKDTGLSGELPLRLQIKNLLKQGSLTIQSLSEQLDSKADTIGRTLRRMREAEQVVKLDDGTWGLAL